MILNKFIINGGFDYTIDNITNCSSMAFWDSCYSHLRSSNGNYSLYSAVEITRFSNTSGYEASLWKSNNRNWSDKIWVLLNSFTSSFNLFIHRHQPTRNSTVSNFNAFCIGSHLLSDFFNESLHSKRVCTKITNSMKNSNWICAKSYRKYARNCN